MTRMTRFLRFFFGEEEEKSSWVFLFLFFFSVKRGKEFETFRTSGSTRVMGMMRSPELQLRQVDTSFS